MIILEIIRNTVRIIKLVGFREGFKRIKTAYKAVQEGATL
jgi:hypothetical protein